MRLVGGIDTMLGCFVVGVVVGILVGTGSIG